MKYIPAIALLVLAAPSCDKVKNLVDKGRSSLANELANQSVSPGSRPDPELQKLVDETPEGVLFRKDLPFPARLEVKTTRNEDISGRVFEKSELGSETRVIKGAFTTVFKVERAGDQVSHTLIESVFAEPVIKGAEVKDPVKKQVAPPSKPAVFVKAGSNWKSASNDFRTANLAQTLSPVFDQLLVANALAPHAYWFGQKRIKIGDELTVTGKSLPLIITGKASGSLKLKLEALEAVEGHPCGVFSISGNYTRKQFPDFDGSLTDDEVTIESGKIWLSLLYPIILKEEASTIQTIRKGGEGGPSLQGQNSSKVSVTREWKPIMK